MTILPTIFSTRVLRDFSKDRKNILDGGCGRGIQALYLARRSAQGQVYGYDISGRSIGDANSYKEKHRIANATFSVANHDDFIPPTQMDMIYTTGSLVGDHEIPPCVDPLEASEDIVQRRLSAFREILNQNGIYIMNWGGNESANTKFAIIAYGCRFALLGKKINHTNPENYQYFDEIVCETSLIFKKF